MSGSALTAARAFSPCSGLPLYAREVCTTRARNWRDLSKRSPDGMGSAEPAVRAYEPFAASRRAIVSDSDRVERCPEHPRGGSFDHGAAAR
jgi:hypothetical protein